MSGRSVALSRPANLSKYASLSGSVTGDGQRNQFAGVLIDVFWKLNSVRPPVQAIAPLSALGKNFVHLFIR